MNNMKNVLFALLVVGMVFMVGCSSSEVVEEISEETNIVSESSIVSRGFSASNVNVGDTLTVTLTKRLDASQTNILVEENFPTGWTVVDAGTGAVVGNTIRWAELTGATSGTYTYTVTAVGNPGTATWTGQYSINGQTPVDIEGLTNVELK